MKETIIRFSVNLNLGKDFLDTVKVEMEDELRIASKKWFVELNSDDHDLIFDHTLKQLKRKVADSSKNIWDMSDRLSLRVEAYKQTEDINLPGKDIADPKMRLVRLRDGWTVDQESTDESVLISDFLEFYKGKIKEWARSGVYYGVASYGQ